MIHFRFKENDLRYLFLTCDNEQDIEICRDLMKHMNLINPRCYLATFKGKPFTEDYLFEYTQSSGRTLFYCSIGLWQVVYKYFKENNVSYDGLDQKYFKRPMQHTLEEFKAIVDSWGLTKTPRPYQYESAYNILCWKRSVSQLATRAGKTLIAYIVFRYCIEYLNAKKILMIVPAVDLVKQGYSDFKEYKEYFKSECIWSGGKLVESSNMSIGTFQSLISFLEKDNKKYNPHFFDDYDIIFVDETHRAVAKQISTIITQPFVNKSKIMFGLTGTLPKEKTIERYALHALLGAKIQTIRPKELMDAGYISDLHIIQHRLYYNDEYKQLDNWLKCAEYAISEFCYIKKQDKKKLERIPLENPEFLIAYEKNMPEQIQNAKKKIFEQPEKSLTIKKLEYKSLIEKYLSISTRGNNLTIEKMMTHFFDERIDYLFNNILPTCDKNTLILVQHRVYIEYLLELLKKKFPNRHIMCIYGNVNDKKRTEIRESMRKYNDIILIATYACVGTGLTLANLCYGVFFESFKSETLNMQSIGRGLGLSELKDKYILHDINDCFNQDLASKKLYLQSLEKIKIYKENEYDYEVKNVYLGKTNKVAELEEYKESLKVKNGKSKKKKDNKSDVKSKAHASQLSLLFTEDTI